MSLAGYSLWGCKGLDTTERAHTHTHIHIYLYSDLVGIPGFPGGSDGKQATTLRETSVQSLGWEDPLGEGMAIHSSILAWRIPMDREAWGATAHGVAKSRTQLSN